MVSPEKNRALPTGKKCVAPAQMRSGLRATSPIIYPIKMSGNFFGTAELTVTSESCGPVRARTLNRGAPEEFGCTRRRSARWEAGEDERAAQAPRPRARWDERAAQVPPPPLHSTPARTGEVLLNWLISIIGLVGRERQATGAINRHLRADGISLLEVYKRSVYWVAC
jgi:hypothetical protein